MSDLRTIMTDIREQHGRLTPQLVLDEARHHDHPLHAYAEFKWDDESGAAEAWRLHVARRLIQTVRVSYESPKTGQRHFLRAFYATRAADEAQFDYELTEEMLLDPLRRKILLRDMERRIAELVAQFEHLDEFWQLLRKTARRKAS